MDTERCKYYSKKCCFLKTCRKNFYIKVKIFQSLALQNGSTGREEYAVYSFPPVAHVHEEEDGIEAHWLAGQRSA
jgi:hypothetical protein